MTTGENRRLLLRALIIAGNDASDGSGQRALVGRTDNVRTMLERAAARGEPALTALDYFDAVVGPLYGYALMLPGLVSWRGPILVEEFLASLAQPAAPQDVPGKLHPPGPSADS